MNWMAWTLPTALFFCGILFMLVVMTGWELRSPTSKRRGWLRFPTTRGDRLFISLLLAAYLHILWLWQLDAAPLPVTGLSLLMGFVLLRWG